MFARTVCLAAAKSSLRGRPPRSKVPTKANVASTPAAGTPLAGVESSIQSLNNNKPSLAGARRSRGRPASASKKDEGSLAGELAAEAGLEVAVSVVTDAAVGVIKAAF